jgi:hypothetical protein
MDAFRIFALVLGVIIVAVSVYLGIAELPM